MDDAPSRQADFLRQMFGLAGKSALVVDNGGNASSDIAIVLARAGAHVTLVDRDAALIDPVLAEIAGSGGSAEGLVFDVEDEAGVTELFRTLDERDRGIDIFVSACGLTANSPLESMTSTFWDQAHSSNLRCVFLCAREAVIRMVAAGRGGRVILISTIGALHPTLHGNLAYGAARAGTLAMMRSIAFDFAEHGIRANAILPGPFPGKVRFHADTLERMRSGPLTGPGSEPGRRPFGWGDPADIGASVAYLAGPSGGFISGQALALDGGYSVS